MTPSPSKRRELLEILRHVANPTLIRPGCLACEIYEGAGDDRTVLYLERWDSLAEAQRHIQSALYLRILAAMELSATQPEIRFYETSRMWGLDLVESLRAPEGHAPSPRDADFKGWVRRYFPADGATPFFAAGKGERIMWLIEENRNPPGREWLGALLIASLLISGCAIGPNFKRPQTALAEKWMAEGQKQIIGKPADQAEWWKAFNDPVLDTLVAQAQNQNLTLQAAALRIVQARTVKSGAIWTEFPLILGPNASYTNFNYSQNVKPDVEVKKGSFEVIRDGRRVRQPRRNRVILPRLDPTAPQIEITRPEIGIADDVKIYQAGFDAIWELDVWGKKRRLIEAASASYQGSIAGYDGMLVSLTAEVAATYIEIRTVEERLRVAHEDISAMERFLAAAQAQADEARVTDLDVQMARTLLTDTQAEIPTLESELRVAENSLCVLLAKPPQDLRPELGGAGRIPSPPREVAAGVPADLLRRRPDVRMAEYAAWSQCARVGVAKGGLLPSFSLFGSLGFASSHTGNFFDHDSFRSAYGGGFNWNPLIYPFTIEPVRLQDARFQESIAEYKEVVLRAAEEVENASVRFVSTQDKLKLLDESAEASRRAAGRALEQYQMGTLAYPGAVEALQYLVSQQDRAIQTRGNVALSLVALYKALGGGWQLSRDKPLLPEDVRKQMEARTDWWSFTGKREIAPREFKKPQ